MNNHTRKTPIHLWIVGIIALLWNSVGAFDYIATRFRIESYMSQFTPEQLAYFYGLPTWAGAAWAIGVWAALAGSITLLLRKSWTVWLLGASIGGMVITSIYSYVLSEGMMIMGTGALAFSAVIWVVAVALFLYARALTRRGILR